MSSVSQAQTTKGDAAARHEIDEEISQLEARIITLKTLRNTYCPFARLHAEIVQEIFCMACRIFAGGAALKISWVCKSWRELSFQTPEMWNHIGSRNPIWIETYLSRSRNRPLWWHLYFSSNYSGDFSHLASLCLESLPRINTLSIRSPWASELDRFPRLHPLWTTPAPILVRLSLHTISLPSDVFSGMFPALKDLQLDRCEFNWTSLPIHPGLQELVVREPGTKTTADDIVHKLRVYGQNLRKLALNGVLLQETVQQHSISNSVPGLAQHTLEKLKYFALYEEPAHAATIVLSQLSFPPRINQARIEVHGGIEQLDTVEAFVSSRGIERWPVTALEIDIQSESIAVSTTEDLTRFNENTPVSADHEDLQAGGSFSVTLNLFDNPFDYMPLFDIIPLPPIKALTLSGGEFADFGPELINHFNTQGVIQRLDISLSYLATFIPSISEQIQELRETTELERDVKDADVDDGMKIECRSVLNFHQLEVLRWYGEFDDKRRISLSYYEYLRQWLMWRRVVGLKVKTLIFEDMTIPPEGFIRGWYNDVVDEVVCRGVEQTDEASMRALFNP